jgi:large subunit ribosomal protein L3
MQGILGRKTGMIHYYGDDGSAKGVTVIEAGPCFVTQIKTASKDGYDAVQIGFDEVRRINSPEKGHLKKAGRFLRHLREFRPDDPDSVEVGQKIDVGIFKEGDLVDITGISKGKGFAGGVKRYHFAGGPKTHGQSDRLRAPGSAGGTTFPGRVLKGKRMAGHMGSRRVTSQHIKVIQADPERNILLVEGAVPGAPKGLLIIKKSGRGKRS